MSAFDRLPREYRQACERLAMRYAISPQNRGIRFAVDLDLARAKTFTHRDTRQQRRGGRR